MKLHVLAFITLTIMFCNAKVIPKSNCDPGFSYTQLGCLHVNVGAKMDWFEANYYCSEAMGGMMIEIFDGSTQAQVMGELVDIGGDFWVGLNDLSEEGNFVWQHSKNPTNFTAWGDQQPLGSTAENCVGLDLSSFYYWSDDDCSAQKQPICSQIKEKLNPCGDGEEWLYGEEFNTCYWRDSTNAMVSFNKAMDMCEAMEANIVTLETESENSLIKTWLQESNDASNWIWLGLTDETSEGDHVWVPSGESATYMDWFPNADHGDGLDYGLLYGPYGYQWTETFSGDVNAVLCEKKIVV